MSGVLENILDTLKRIEAQLAGADVPAPAAAEKQAPATDKPVTRGRGRPVGSTKDAAPKAEPVVETKVADDSSFLDEEPEPEVKVTKDDVRAALVAFNKKANSEQKTRQLLKEHGGVDNLSALPEDKYAAVAKAARAAS